jgi:hypothetical protein
MTMRQALEMAMHREGGADAFESLRRNGLFVVDEDTMAGAIHSVYCSVTADHSEPNDKDRAQARQLLDSIRSSTAGAFDAADRA